MIFALWTVPLIVLVKLLGLGEFLQAVTECHVIALLCFFTLAIDLEPLCRLEFIEEGEIKATVPNNFQDHIVLTPLIRVKVRVEAHI